jgi:hypothetical protein
MRGEEYDNIATKLFDTICIIDGGFMDAGIWIHYAAYGYEV